MREVFSLILLLIIMKLSLTRRCETYNDESLSTQTSFQFR